MLSWETASELDNAGFNLWRGMSPAGPDSQLNGALIPSQSPGSSGGFAYTWEDSANLVPGATIYYWLEDVSLSGVATRHGPVSTAVSAPTAVTLGDLHSAGSESPGWLAGMVRAVQAFLAGLGAH